MTDHLEVLEALAALDGELTAAENDHRAELKALEDAKQRFTQLSGEIARADEGVREMDKLRGELVGETRQLTHQMEGSRDKMGRCRNEREANAIEREIEELRRLIRERDVEMQRLTELSEQAKQFRTDAEMRRAELETQQGASEDDLTARLGDLTGRTGVLRSERDALVAKLPPALYRRYELTRKRRSPAISATTNGTCTVCHVTMAPVLLARLIASGEVDTCPSCQRLIYYRPAVEAPEGDSSTEG